MPKTPIASSKKIDKLGVWPYIQIDKKTELQTLNYSNMEQNKSDKNLILSILCGLAALLPAVMLGLAILPQLGGDVLEKLAFGAAVAALVSFVSIVFLKLTCKGNADLLASVFTFMISLCTFIMFKELMAYMLGTTLGGMIICCAFYCCGGRLKANARFFAALSASAASILAIIFLLPHSYLTCMAITQYLLFAAALAAVRYLSHGKKVLSPVETRCLMLSLCVSLIWPAIIIAFFC